MCVCVYEACSSIRASASTLHQGKHTAPGQRTSFLPSLALPMFCARCDQALAHALPETCTGEELMACFYASDAGLRRVLWEKALLEIETTPHHSSTSP